MIQHTLQLRGAIKARIRDELDRETRWERGILSVDDELWGAIGDYLAWITDEIAAEPWFVFYRAP